MHRILSSAYVIIVAISIHACGATVLADEAQERIVAGAGYPPIPQSSKIFVGEVKSVSWNAKAKVPDRTGKATFRIREGIRGSKKGDTIVLPVQEIGLFASVHGDNYFWQGLKFTKGSLWLVFVGKEKHAILNLSQLESVNAPVVKDVAEVADIDSKKPEDKLKAIRDILGGKALKPVLAVNYGVQAAGPLVRYHPQACSILLSVAAMPTNPPSIRDAALDAIYRNLADGRQKDERPIWLEEIKMLLEAAPKMKDSSLDLVNQYSSLLAQAIDLGSWEKSVLVPRNVKLASATKVNNALASMAVRLDKSVLALKEKLATAKAPTTKFPEEWKRKQRIVNLQSSIAWIEESTTFLKLIAKSAATRPASSPAGDPK